MGCYDTFGKLGVQLKCTECRMDYFNIGDEVPLTDGIYVGYEGCVVVYHGKFVAELPLDAITDKWGSPIEVDINERNPLTSVVKEYVEKRMTNE